MPKADLWLPEFGGEGGSQTFGRMDMFILLTVIGSQVYVYIKVCQIVHFEYVHIKVYQSYLKIAVIKINVLGLCYTF